MQYGVREICNVVLKAKAAQKIGNRLFYKNEPVIYFDSLKTSSLEGAANTVYAEGGRGNARLIAWEGERTITFTMEDALISPISFSILSGAGIIEPTSEKPLIVHCVEQTSDVEAGLDYVRITLDNEPYFDPNGDDCVYVMPLDDLGQVYTEPYIAKESDVSDSVIELQGRDSAEFENFTTGGVVLVDYYTKRTESGFQVNITPDKFGGNFYLEASCLWRNQQGIDCPAEFIIPNCKVQSNFTFSMAATGDPSTFTFTMDAFPDYTRFDKTKKVLCAIQVIGQVTSGNAKREKTHTTRDINDAGDVYDPATGDIINE